MAGYQPDYYIEDEEDHAIQGLAFDPVVRGNWALHGEYECSYGDFSSRYAGGDEDDSGGGTFLTTATTAPTELSLISAWDDQKRDSHDVTFAQGPLASGAYNSLQGQPQHHQNHYTDYIGDGGDGGENTLAYNLQYLGDFCTNDTSLGVAGLQVHDSHTLENTHLNNASASGVEGYSSYDPLTLSNPHASNTNPGGHGGFSLGTQLYPPTFEPPLASQPRIPGAVAESFTQHSQDPWSTVFTRASNHTAEPFAPFDAVFAPQQGGNVNCGIIIRSDQPDADVHDGSFQPAAPSPQWDYYQHQTDNNNSYNGSAGVPPDLPGSAHGHTFDISVNPPQPLRHLTCGLCVKPGKPPVTFTMEKDLERHVDSKHGEGAGFFCACGRTIRGRKDNFKRHLENLHESPDGQQRGLLQTYAHRFECGCGFVSGHVDHMLSHLRYDKCRP